MYIYIYKLGHRGVVEVIENNDEYFYTYIIRKREFHVVSGAIRNITFFNVTMFSSNFKKKHNKNANQCYESWYNVKNGHNPEKPLQKSNFKENV